MTVRFCGHRDGRCRIFFRRNLTGSGYGNNVFVSRRPRNLICGVVRVKNSLQDIGRADIHLDGSVGNGNILCVIRNAVVCIL